MSISGDIFALSLDPSGRGRTHPTELGCALAAAEPVGLAILRRIVITPDAILARDLDPVGEPMLDWRLAALDAAHLRRYDEERRLTGEPVLGTGPRDAVGAEALDLINAYDSARAEVEQATVDEAAGSSGYEAVLERVIHAVTSGSARPADEALLALMHIGRLAGHLVSGPCSATCAGR